MKCLSDVQIQAIVDGEASADVRAHAAECVRCGDRVRERRETIDGIVRAVGALDAIPAGVDRRIHGALATGPSQGATRLKGTPQRSPRRRAFWSAVAVAAATLAGIFVIAPMFRGPATVSAAEILARSANRLAQGVTSGVELLDYELTLDGVPREMMPDQVNGRYRVKQAIDHDVSGRYRIATYDHDGQLRSSILQDPAGKRRVVTIRLGDQPFRFDFSLADSTVPSPIDVERLHMQASVALMQTSGNQSLQTIESPAGRQFRIEVPRVSAQTPDAVWDLSEAQVVVDAEDYHVVEFAVKGTFLKQPYSVSYRLISREVAAQADVPAGTFDVPDEPGVIAIQGDGSAVPARDVLVLALRELTRMKQGR